MRVGLLLIGALYACGPNRDAPVEPTHTQATTPLPEPLPKVPPRAVDDRALVMQALIDHKDLAAYVHAEVPGRLPLLLEDGGHLPGKPGLASHGTPVRYVDASEQSQALIIEELDVEALHASVLFRYPREGVVGNAELAQKNGSWNVTRIDLREQSSASSSAPPAFSNPNNLLSAWTDCTKDTCVMIRNECCDAWSVTNTHREAAQTEMNQRRSKAMKGVRPGASPCRRSCASPGTPTCVSGQCAFAR